MFLNHRPAPRVTLQPTMTIRLWMIVKTSSGEELLTGVLPTGYTWRVTTPIIDFRASARCVTTRSGRKYELGGPPAADDLDLLVIHAQLALNEVGPAEDASEKYAQAMAAAIH